MRISQAPELQRAVTKATKVQQALQSAGSDEYGGQLADQIEAVNNERFVIGVVGAAKRGKSTLINGLLGRRDDRYAPIGKFPATNVTTIFGHNAANQTTVRLNDGSSIDITQHEIRSYVCEEQNPHNRKGVRSVEALGPFPALEPGVFIVDTPGANNALSEMHGELLLQYLPNLDAVIFLVTADEPISASEQSLLNAIRGNDTRKLFFAVNKIDRLRTGDMEEDELAEGLEHNRQILADAGFANSPVFQISAKDFFETSHDDGTLKLLESMRTLITQERLQILSDRLVERTDNLLEFALDELTLELAESKATAEELEAERKLLKSYKDKLQRNRPARERKFQQLWEAAFTSLEESVHRVRKELTDDYDAVIAKMNPMKISDVAKTIHSDVAQSFTERLAPEIRRCEEAVSDAQKLLIDEAEQALIAVRTELSSTAFKGSALREATNVGGAATPALITSAAAAALPGLVGKLIIGAGTTLSTGIFATIFQGGVAALATGVAGVMSVIFTPIALGAAGLAAYRAVSAWRAGKAQNKNELRTSVGRLIDEATSQIADQVRQYRKKSALVLEEYDADLEERISAADQNLIKMIENRPSQESIGKLEKAIATLQGCRSSAPQTSIEDNSIVSNLARGE